MCVEIKDLALKVVCQTFYPVVHFCCTNKSFPNPHSKISQGNESKGCQERRTMHQGQQVLIKSLKSHSRMSAVSVKDPKLICY